MTYAIVPAAGSGTRMGRPKLGLPIGNSTILQRVITALRDGGVDVVLVVIGPQTPELVPLAESAGGTCLLLSSMTSDMRETVQAGLRRLEEWYSPGAEDIWLLAPGDCPAFTAQTVRLLFTEAVNSTGAPISVPTFNGRRGHPTLFRWEHAANILRIPSGSGISSYVSSGTVREVPCDDSGILWDVDTPSDFEKLSERFIIP